MQKVKEVKQSSMKTPVQVETISAQPPAAIQSPATQPVVTQPASSQSPSIQPPGVQAKPATVHAVHDPNVLEDTEKRIVGILGNHIGRFNAIRMKKLAEIVGIQERSVRNQVNHLKFYHKIPIMSWDDFREGGYYLPAEGADSAVCIEMFLSRVWTSLKNVATLKKISMIEAGELVALELEKMSTSEDEAKKKFMTGLPKPPEGYSLITALVKHAKENPDKYQRDLHIIQNIFGAKFIQRKKLDELAKIQAKLNLIVSEVSELEN